MIDLFQRRGLHGNLPAVADLIDASGDCWEWQGAVNFYGYGTIGIKRTRPGAHRVVWEALVGPIPEGLTLDHLCRNKVCVNPDHLEVLTTGDNTRRGVNYYRTRDTCKHGHAFTPENTLQRPGHGRVCRRCRDDRNAKRIRTRSDALDSQSSGETP